MNAPSMADKTLKATPKNIPDSIPFIDLNTQREKLHDQILKGLEKVMEEGSFILGKEVALLEQELEAFVEVPHAITCANGTDALLLGLRAKNIGVGDAIFVPSFTFAATAEVVALMGATPVFVDVDLKTFNMCPKSLKDAISFVKTKTALKPKGVFVVDLFGLPADYDLLAPIIKEEGLWLAVDAAQSYGATYKGKSTVTFGDFATTSFYPAKPLGCYGDGGALFTKDPEFASLLKSLRVHGQGSHRYEHARLGLNSRLDTFQAVVLLEKLTLFKDEINLRNKIAARYTKAFKEKGMTPEVPQGSLSVWAQYTLRVQERSMVMDKLKEAGVPTVIYYPIPLHLQEAFKDCSLVPAPLPNTETLAKEVMSLPMHPYLKEEVQDYIIQEVLAALA